MLLVARVELPVASDRYGEGGYGCMRYQKSAHGMTLTRGGTATEDAVVVSIFP